MILSLVINNPPKKKRKVELYKEPGKSSKWASRVVHFLMVGEDETLLLPAYWYM